MTAAEQVFFSSAPVPVALVYWGRLGAGAALTAQIAEALAADPRFALYVSRSEQSELAIPAVVPPERHLPIETFAGPLSLFVNSLRLNRTIGRLIVQLTALKVQAIVTVMPHVWGLALQRAAKRAGIRTILIAHDADPHPGERRPLFDELVRREIRGSDRIVTLSDAVADRLIARGDVAAASISRLWHPTFSFAGASGTEHPARPFRLLFFGRILPYKGVPLLLEAFARLRAAHVNCTLRVAGRGRLDASAALMSQPGLTIEQGWIAPDAIGGLLAEADAIVLPYLEASQSGVIAAAYGAGIPVVATPVGGLMEQVKGDETGILAAAADSTALAGAIERLIVTPGLYEKCRAGAVQRAEAQSMPRFAHALGDAVIATLAQEPR